MFISSSYEIPIARVKREGGGFEVPTCRSTKTAPFNEEHVACTHLSCPYWIMCKRESKGNASLSFLDA